MLWNQWVHATFQRHSLLSIAATAALKALKAGGAANAATLPLRLLEGACLIWAP